MDTPIRTDDDRATVSRAKTLLMRVLRLTEPRAYRAIQVAAMNRRVSMAQVARELLHEISPHSR